MPRFYKDTEITKDMIKPDIVIETALKIAAWYIMNNSDDAELKNSIKNTGIDYTAYSGECVADMCRLCFIGQQSPGYLVDSICSNCASDDGYTGTNPGAVATRCIILKKCIDMFTERKVHHIDFMENG